MIFIPYFLVWLEEKNTKRIISKKKIIDKNLYFKLVNYNSMLNKVISNIQPDFVY